MQFIVLSTILGLAVVCSGAKKGRRVADLDGPVVKSRTVCEPIPATRGQLHMTVTRFFGAESPVVQTTVTCSTASRLDGTLMDLPEGVTSCLTPKLAILLVADIQRRVDRVCIPDSIYDSFVRDHTKGPLVFVDFARDSVKRSPVRKDLRLISSPEEEARFLSLSPALYEGAVIANERVTSFMDRMVHARPLPIRPLLAIAPIINEYVKPIAMPADASSAASGGSADLHGGQYVAIRQLGDVRVGFGRPISQAELQARTSPLEDSAATVGQPLEDSGSGESSESPMGSTAGSSSHVSERFHGIDHEGTCCFCDSPRVCEEDELVRLACFHEYHARCIHRWVVDEAKLTCPECRSDI